ncbi:MAG: sigma-70 family RNA polymerase sigma factor [Eubacteriales bacterium]|nr:sigma-70 family RNA polymerase sigma factor [Eubacteriales bacterium]
MNYQQELEKDELRARFTGWLETTVYRAKLNYIRKTSQKIETVSIEEVAESSLVSGSQEQEWCRHLSPKDAFDFEEEKLAKAFAELPLMRQRILTMLFVEEKKPDEIAAKLNCSIQHVYNQRSLALKKLRTMLAEGGDML